MEIDDIDRYEEERKLEPLLEDLERLLNNSHAFLSGCEREVCERVLADDLRRGDAVRCRDILQNHVTETAPFQARKTPDGRKRKAVTA